MFSAKPSLLMQGIRQALKIQAAYFRNVLATDACPLVGFEQSTGTSILSLKAFQLSSHTRSGQGGPHGERALLLPHR